MPIVKYVFVDNLGRIDRQVKVKTNILHTTESYINRFSNSKTEVFRDEGHLDRTRRNLFNMPSQVSGARTINYSR